MSLNEVTIQKPLVQIVLKSKHNLYHDGKKHLGQNVLMATNVVGTLFLRSFVARTVRARENAGFTQEEMCGILHISQGRYKHYEKRSPLPHELIPIFCTATKVSVDWLFTGKEAKAEKLQKASQLRAR
jgi:hypothetical protein